MFEVVPQWTGKTGWWINPVTEGFHDAFHHMSSKVYVTDNI